MGGDQAFTTRVVAGPRNLDRGCMPSRTTVARHLRRTMRHTEWRVWDRVRGRKLDGWKFRRQHPIGPYFVDLYCPAARLVVEINGPTHYGDAGWAYDERRTACLKAEGYRVLQFSVGDVDQDLDSVIETIYRELLETGVPAPQRRLKRSRPGSPPALRATSPRRGGL